MELKDKILAFQEARNTADQLELQLIKPAQELLQYLLEKIYKNVDTCAPSWEEYTIHFSTHFVRYTRETRFDGTDSFTAPLSALYNRKEIAEESILRLRYYKALISYQEYIRKLYL